MLSGNNDEEVPDDFATADEGDGDDTEESSKSKRTVERNFGYGFNDITSRLQGQADNQVKFRAYPYQQLRLHSTLRSAQDIANQQQQAETAHRPHSSTARLSSVSNHNYRTGIHADAQDPLYFTRSSYQPVPTYRGSPSVSVPSSINGAPVYSPGSPHAASLFSGPPPQAPSFFTGHSLASHHHFPAVTPSNLPNAFFGAGNFHGGPLVHQHAGSSLVALLQNPSGHFGPPILPVIILRVNNDASGSSVLQHQSGGSPNVIHAGLHGLNLQALLYPVQQFQVSQPPVFSHFDTTQSEESPQLLYQERSPSGEISKTQHVKPSAATTPQTAHLKMPYVHQKKPLIPSLPTDSPQKLRKDFVITETDPRSNNGYSQYKYGYKDKA